MVYSAWSHWSINPHGVSFSLFKKRPRHRCFPVITQNIFNTTSSQDTSMWLLLNCFKVNHKHTIVTSKVFLDHFEQKSTQNSSKMRHFTVCTPPSSFFLLGGEEEGGGGGGVEPHTKFSKRWSFTEPQLWEGDCWKKRGNFIQGGCNFYKKIN